MAEQRDQAIARLAEHVETVTNAIEKLAFLNRPSKTFNIQPFDGRAERVAIFISEVETSY